MEELNNDLSQEGLPDIPKDPYKALGVDRTASSDEIEKGYKILAHKYHPDINPGNKKAEEWFMAVTEARDLLLEPTKNIGRSHFFKNFSPNNFSLPKSSFEEWQEKEKTRADEISKKEEKYWRRFQ